MYLQYISNQSECSAMMQHLTSTRDYYIQVTTTSIVGYWQWKIFHLEQISNPQFLLFQGQHAKHYTTQAPWCLTLSMYMAPCLNSKCNLLYLIKHKKPRSPSIHPLYHYSNISMQHNANNINTYNYFDSVRVQPAGLYPMAKQTWGGHSTHLAILTMNH